MMQVALPDNHVPFEPLISPEPTPLEEHEFDGKRVWLKRDDYYVRAGIAGGKVRTCAFLVAQAVRQGYAGVVTAGSRHSPQVAIVARLCADLGIAAHVVVPAGPMTPEIADALEHHAVVHRIRPGHNSVIVARAREYAKESGYFEVPFGMECWEAVRQTAGEYLATQWPAEMRRIVVPVGSGMTMAGILWGRSLAGQLEHHIVVMGVQVGADPARRLKKYAPRDQGYILAKSQYDYSEHITGLFAGVRLDSVYENKAADWMREDDCLWVVGIRPSEVSDTNI